MSNQGVTWTDVEAAKAELDRGRLPLFQEQWRALGTVKIPDFKQIEADPSDHPLRVLFRYVLFGRYPPPELHARAPRSY